jgi:hypothetical protein
MSNLRAIDMMVVTDLFEPEGSPGYILNFNDRTFAQFFADLNIDIDDKQYFTEGGSKGKRFRYFLKVADNPTAAKVLKAAWEYREAIRAQFGHEEKKPNTHGRFLALLARVEGGPPPAEGDRVVKPAFDRQKFTDLHQGLMDLGGLEPHPRGFAFEKYLKRLFETFGIKADGSFRMTGEQIDGSFRLDNETYLLEAKWVNELVVAKDLFSFQGTVENKAGWTRGLYVSYAGFSPDGLEAFGRGKRIVGLDGLDLSEALSRELPFDEVLRRKVHHMGQRGQFMARVRDLF